MTQLNRTAKIFGHSVLFGVALLSECTGNIAAQNTPAASGQVWLHPVETFDIATADNSMTLRRHAETEKPFTVAGECGAMMGQQDGGFESWIFPVKLFSRMTIEAHINGYDVP